jgi:hypothetical protein
VPSKKEESLEETLQDRQQRQRTALNNAYAFILADQNTQAFVNFTFEDALDLQIEQIEGPSSDIRPNRLERLDRIEQQVATTVEQLKSLPDENFQEANELEDVNTTEA